MGIKVPDTDGQDRERKEIKYNQLERAGVYDSLRRLKKECKSVSDVLDDMRERMYFAKLLEI